MALDFGKNANDTWKRIGDPVDILGMRAKPPKRQFFGGSEEALDQTRKDYEAGRTSGGAQARTGLDMLSRGSDMASMNSQRGSDVYGYGMQTAEQARRSENQALAGLLATAQQRGPSQAEAQQRAGLAQLQRSMLGQAADVRGGNQAGAFRNAQAAGSDMGLQLLERQGALRAAEEDAAIRRELAAREAVANAYANQTGRGYGLLGLGLGTMGQAAGQVGGFGAQYAGIGAGREGNYINAVNAVNAAQLDADLGRERARFGQQSAMMGGMLGTAGGIVGSIYGGQAGGQAGSQLGGSFGGRASEYGPSAETNPYSSQLGNPR